MGVALLFQPRCKLWRCPACGEINRRLWTARTHHAAQTLLDQGVKLDVVCLTHRGHHTPESARRRWRDCWPKLAQALRREVPKPLYCYVHEVHKSGIMHTHLIVSHVANKRFWKDDTARRGFGYMNHCAPLAEPRYAAAYLSKYLAKQLGAHDWPKHWKRVTTCRRWPKLPEPEPSPHWAFAAIDRGTALADLPYILAREGYKLHQVDHRSAWDIVDQLTLELS